MSLYRGYFVPGAVDPNGTLVQLAPALAPAAPAVTTGLASNPIGWGIGVFVGGVYVGSQIGEGVGETIGEWWYPDPYHPPVPRPNPKPTPENPPYFPPYDPPCDDDDDDLDPCDNYEYGSYGEAKKAIDRNLGGTSKKVKEDDATSCTGKHYSMRYKGDFFTIICCDCDANGTTEPHCNTN